MKTSDLQKTEKQYVFYKSCQCSWPENNTNPKCEDENYHLTYEEAKEKAIVIDLNIGFYPVVASIAIDFDKIEEDEEFELSELDNYRKYYGDYETIFEGCVFEGDDITGSIVIEWNWVRYVGYCQNLVNIGIAGEYPFYDIKTQKDLISGNEERTFRSNYSVLLTSKEVEDCNDLKEAIEDALNNSYWKWNYFKNNPLSEFITNRIGDIIK